MSNEPNEPTPEQLEQARIQLAREQLAVHVFMRRCPQYTMNQRNANTLYRSWLKLNPDGGIENWTPEKLQEAYDAADAALWDSDEDLRPTRQEKEPETQVTEWPWGKEIVAGDEARVRSMSPVEFMKHMTSAPHAAEFKRQIRSLKLAINQIANS